VEEGHATKIKGLFVQAFFFVLGLVKKLGLDRRQASLDCRQASFVFGSSEDKAGKEAQHQKRNAQQSAFLVLG